MKAAKEFGLDINYFTFNANNPGTPAQMGSWGAEKVSVMWNCGHNAPTPERAPMYLGTWAKQGSRGVKYDAEKTGYGFRSEEVWDSYVSAQPTSCQMSRPRRHCVA